MHREFFRCIGKGLGGQTARSEHKNVSFRGFESNGFIRNPPPCSELCRRNFPTNRKFTRARSRCIGKGLPMHRESPWGDKPRALNTKMYDFGVLKVMVLFGIHPHAQNAPKGTGGEFPMHREIPDASGTWGGQTEDQKKSCPRINFRKF